MPERVSRRGMLAGLGAGLFGGAIGPATAGQVNRTQTDAIRLAGTAAMDWEAEQMQYTVSFELPSQVTELSVTYSSLSLPHLSVGSKTNLEESDGAYVWSGGEDPKLRLDIDLTSSEFPAIGVGYYGEETALTSIPHSGLSWRYTGSSSPEVVHEPNTFDGEGHATEELAFAGAHEAHTRTVDGTDITFVVPDSVERQIDATAALDIVEIGESALGGARLQYDSKGLFVIPDGYLEGLYSGRAVGDSFLVLESAWELERIDNVLAHEFAHTVFGGFGSEGMLWLDEAIAEYYGYLISLNAGLGDETAFFEAVEAGEEFADAVLADREQVVGTRANYQKGAHVLAALDAEIRQRTSDEATLLAVFGTDHDLETYDGFKAAANEVTDDDSMGEWIDDYVQSEALPEVPQDSALFTLPSVTWADIDTPSVSTDSSGPTTGESGTPATSTPEVTFNEVGPGFSVLGGLAGIAGVSYLLYRQGDGE